MINYINILQWNTRSITSNRESLESFLENENIHIACISETWLKDTTNFRLSKYSIICENREDGKGGVAILIRNNLVWRPFEINIEKDVNFQFVAISFCNLIIVSAYIPPNLVVKQDKWEELLGKIQMPFLICGDLNANHPIWGSSCK